MSDAARPPAVDAGTGLTELIEEFTNRLQAGEALDADAYVREHPQYAEPLRRLLPPLQVLADLSQSAAPIPLPVSGGPSSRPADLEVGVLGDFRIVREVGRGGMGVVYEAEQISLGRRVALKVLPFAAALDGRQLQRFKNEAQAAAGLHHTNIVPVHAVGCERGVHYYAMQFIEGQTLAALIRQLRQRDGLELAAPAEAAASPSEAILEATGPYVSAATADTASQPAATLATERSSRNPAFFRTVAQLGMQAAEALEHAHQLGVAHRDIKPANLLVDGRGNLWIADFGLAHCQSQAGLTMTGDLVGTLRYMSPEQALAQRGGVDHRTDIYSLGVSLYELLTLEPAFPGRDRQELLRQLAFEEPRPPRRLNAAIPAELEIIVLKAIGKDPAERYATAKDLADDLGRYLRDETIRAKRPTLWQRFRKWSRRHKGAVVFATLAGVLLLVLSVAVLAVSSVVIARERREATLQRDVARAQRQLARQAVDKMFTQVAEKWLSQQPRLEPMQREFLEEALHYYQEFAEDQSTDPELRLAASEAYRRVADIQDKLGESAKATEALNRAIALVEQLVAQSPEQARYRAALAEYRTKLGSLLIESDRPTEAEAQYLESSSSWEKIVAECPEVAEYRLDLCHAYSGLANVRLYVGRAREAIEGFKESLSLLEKLPADLRNTPRCRYHHAFSYHHLGWAWYADGRFREAEESTRQAVARLEKLVEDFPKNTVFRHQLALDLWWLGFQLATVHHAMNWRLGELTFPWATARSQEAEAALRRALDMAEKLASEFPATPAYQRLLADCHRNLGELLRQSGRAGEAEKEFRKALQRCEQLLAEFPAIPTSDWVNAMELRFDLTCQLLANRPFHEIEEAYNKGVPTLEKLATDYPSIHAFRYLLALCHYRFAGVLKESGRAREAQEKLAEALRFYDKLVIEAPLVRHNYWRDLFGICFELEALQFENAEFQDAEKVCRKSLALAERQAAEFPAMRVYRECLATSHHRLGLVLCEAGRPKDAEMAYRQALLIWAQLAEELPTEFRYRWAECHNDLACLFITRPAEDYRDPSQAVRLAQRAVEIYPQHGAFWNTLGTAYYRAGDCAAAVKELEKAMTKKAGGDCYDWFFLAMAHSRLDHQAEARKFYDRGVTWMEENKPKLEKSKLQSARFRRFRAEAEALLGISSNKIGR